MGAIVKHHTFALHLFDAAGDVMLLHFEIGNAVSEKAAGLGIFFVDMDVVADAPQLLRARKAGGARPDDRDLLAGPCRRRLGFQPLGNGAVGDRAFDRFNGDGILVDIERA